jgi:hypothetical protein
VQFLVQGKGRVEEMKPYVQYMNHLLRTIYDAVSEDDRFELSYNDYLQVCVQRAPFAVPPVLPTTTCHGAIRCPPVTGLFIVQWWTRVSCVGCVLHVVLARAPLAGSSAALDGQPGVPDV